jgi:hypothetical protein
MSIGDYLKEGVSTVEISDGFHLVTGSSTIKINGQGWRAVQENNEIRLSVEKRFKGKKTVHGTPGFAELVKWCLATDSYKVCQGNLDKVCDSDVELAWEFIDTMSVSSTKRCRDTLGMLKGGRSATGFRRHHVGGTGGSRPKARVTRNAVPPTYVKHSDAGSGGYRTLEEAVLEDCMHWVRTSNDPVESALRLRSGLLESAKGGDHLGAQRRGVSLEHRISE